MLQNNIYSAKNENLSNQLHYSKAPQVNLAEGKNNYY